MFLSFTSIHCTQPGEREKKREREGGRWGREGETQRDALTKQNSSRDAVKTFHAKINKSSFLYKVWFSRLAFKWYRDPVHYSQIYLFTFF